MSSVVYLLGAGFSKALAPTMPLLSALTQPLLPPELSGLKDLDVEAAFTLLFEPQAWRMDHVQHLAEASAAAWRFELAFQIGEAQENAVTAAVLPDWGTDFVAQCHEDESTVLTMNYDVLFERIYSTLGSADNAARVRDPEHSFPWGIYPLSLPLPRLTVPGGTVNRSSGVKLVKLHGSINWLQDRRNPNQLVCSDLHLSTPEATSDTRAFLDDEFPALEPFLVPPVLSKPIHKFGTRYLDLWMTAATALQQAEELVVLGYSFPASDIAIRGLLAENLPEGSTITVVRPESPGSVEEQFSRLFPNDRFRIRSEYSIEGDYQVIAKYQDLRT